MYLRSNCVHPSMNKKMKSILQPLNRKDYGKADILVKKFVPKNFNNASILVSYD